MNTPVVGCCGFITREHSKTTGAFIRTHLFTPLQAPALGVGGPQE
jgi:hypothetical protein